MTLSQEWFSPAELATMGLPGLPGTRQAIQVRAEAEWRRPETEGRAWRVRKASGGGFEYHYAILPMEAQAKLSLTLAVTEAVPARVAAQGALQRDEMWAHFERLTQKKKDRAQAKLIALDTIATLVLHGVSRVAAMQQVAAMQGVQVSSLYAWEKLVAEVPRHDWLPYLAPRHAGRAGSGADCSTEAWEAVKADFLRPEAPTFAACYRRLQRMAIEQGWTIPSERTLERRIDDLPAPLLVLRRQGADALKRMYPAQERDRGVFHALQAVNADGHKWDVFVRWEDGTIGRPLMVAFQDLYSGKILSWRVDRSENKEAVRLAFGDLVEQYGIPDLCWLDNGRSFASKWLTGRTPNRYRFKVRDDEPAGIMTTLGVQVHWTTPYAGQSKPIERAFRDFAGDIAKHPKFAGAYVGNSPMAKPENYGNAAVPIDVFLAVVSAEITAHNARLGRETRVCQGKSFDEVFNASYARSPITKATEEQRRMWLLASEAIGTSRMDGSISLEGNRYWSSFLAGWAGQKVTIRFDPAALQDALHVYRMDNVYLGMAPCIEAVGFNDAAAAREHAQKRRAWMRTARDLAKIELSMSIEQVAALLPEPETPTHVESKVVRLMPTRGNTALAAAPDEQAEDDLSWLAESNAARREMRGLHVVGDNGDNDNG